MNSIILPYIEYIIIPFCYITALYTIIISIGFLFNTNYYFYIKDKSINILYFLYGLGLVNLFFLLVCENITIIKLYECISVILLFFSAFIIGLVILCIIYGLFLDLYNYTAKKRGRK